MRTPHGILLILLLSASGLAAQQTADQKKAPANAGRAQETSETAPGKWEVANAAGGKLSAEQLDNFVQPLVLLPDMLLDMVCEASRSPGLLADAEDLLARSKEFPTAPKSWPDSVQRLLHFPSVIAALDEHMSWAVRLGNAMEHQRKDVIAAIQRVRQRAVALGNLVSDDKQKVVPGGELGDRVKIVLTDPKVIYVPHYDPDQVLLEHDADCPGWLTYGEGIRFDGDDVAAALTNNKKYTSAGFRGSGARMTVVREGGGGLGWIGRAVRHDDDH